jgi:DNA-binding CsgD family transcriptional regulator
LSTSLGLSGPWRTWPIVGRDRELAAIAQARSTGTNGVVVYAPAGVGKSRVAREVLIQAEREGAATAWVQATRSAAAMPLGAFAGLIPPEVRSEDLFVLLRRSSDALAELAGTRDLVVGVDDGQLLDPTSAALVLHLVNAAAAFVVTTVRSGDPCPDAIVNLWKDSLVPRLELAGLGKADTVTLVETILGGPVERGLAHWIWESSRGNAMYVRELLLGALGEGALREVDGLWRMPERPPISPSLLELISTRLAGLNNDELRVLELLALGEPLYVSELEGAVGGDRLAALEARELIAVDGPARGDGEVRLAHPLYGDGIRSTMGSYRTHVTRLALVDMVTARGELTPELALRVARWLLDAGEPISTATLLRAAREANLSGDPELGTRLARDAVEAGAGIEAALVLARSYSIRNRYEDAADVLAAAESSIQTQDHALSYLHQQVEVLYWGLKRVEPVRALLERARGWWPDEEWLGRLAPVRLMSGMAGLGTLGDAGGILAESSQLVGSEAIAPEGRRHLEVVELAGLYRAGRGVEADELARRIRRPLPLRDSTDASIWSLSVGIVCELGVGVHEAGLWAYAALEESVRLGDRAAAGMAALTLGHLSLLEGRLLDATRWLAEAQLHLEHHDPVGLLVMASALQACVASLTHDHQAADAALERCRASVSGEEPLPTQARFLVCADAWAAAAGGDSAEGCRILLDAAAGNVGSPIYTARVLYEAFRLGAPAGELASTLHAVSDACDAPLIAAKAAHVSHVAEGDARGLLTVVDEFERIGARLYACEAAAKAARVFLEQGREDSARRAAARAQQLFLDGQGRPPLPAGGLEATVGLTQREAQVVELTALGLTNRQVAERLVLSTRTVESHLYRAMQKLGVKDRSEL